MASIFCPNCTFRTRRQCPKCKGKGISNLEFPYPKLVCALDIETYKTDFSYKRNSKIALAGMKIFKFFKGKYFPKGYSYFTEDKLKELKLQISSFEGLIIGFNIYKFDLEVLEGYFSESFIEKIKRKTIDLFFLLKFLNHGFFKGLNLNALGKQNLGIGKSLDISGGQIPKLWLSGKKDKVIKYNHRDCDLTFKLWHRLVKQGFLNFTDIHPFDGEIHKTLRLDSGSLNYLIQKKMIKKYYPLIAQKLANFEVHRDLGGTWLENSRLPS